MNTPIIDPSTLTEEQIKKIKDEYINNEEAEAFCGDSESVWYDGMNYTLEWLFGEDFFRE